MRLQLLTYIFAASASPLERRAPTPCKSVVSSVNAQPEASSATAFCSSLLSIGTTTRTYQTTGITTSTSTVTAPTSTATLFTTYNVLVVSVYSTATSLTTSDVTRTLTWTVVGPPTTTTSTTTVSTQPTPTRRTTMTVTSTSTRVVTLVALSTITSRYGCGAVQKRAAPTAPVPSMWRNLAADQITAACSCLPIPQVAAITYSTKYSTVTATATSTPISTKKVFIATSTAISSFNPTGPANSNSYDSTRTETIATTTTQVTPFSVTLLTWVTAGATVVQPTTVTVTVPPTATSVVTVTTITTRTSTSTAPTPTVTMFDILANNGQYVVNRPSYNNLVLDYQRDSIGWPGWRIDGTQLKSRYSSGDYGTTLYNDAGTIRTSTNTDPTQALQWFLAADGTLTVKAPNTTSSVISFPPNADITIGHDAQGSSSDIYGFTSVPIAAVSLHPLRAVGRCS